MISCVGMVLRVIPWRPHVHALCKSKGHGSIVQFMKCVPIIVFQSPNTLSDMANIVYSLSLSLSLNIHLFLLYVYVCFVGMSICALCTCRALRNQKRALDPLEL